MRHASSRTRPWYREPWPWLLMAAPAASIVMGAVVWALAETTDDGLVANDYYQRGLAINQKLNRVPADAEPRLSAIVRVASDGEVRARVEGATSRASAAAIPTIRLRLAQPARSTPDRVIVLTRDAGGDYVGTLGEQTVGRWVVTLESDAWRLPTTTVLGRLTEIRLGVPERS